MTKGTEAQKTYPRSNKEYRAAKVWRVQAGGSENS